MTPEFAAELGHRRKARRIKGGSRRGCWVSCWADVVKFPRARASAILRFERRPEDPRHGPMETWRYTGNAKMRYLHLHCPYAPEPSGRTNRWRRASRSPRPKPNESMKTQTRSAKPAGFALVVTLSLMILLTILAVGLLSLSSISLRAASHSPECQSPAATRGWL